MAEMHSQSYHINITSDWDAQPVLLYQHYKTAGVHGQYYNIIITNDCDAQPVLSYKHYKMLRYTANTTIPTLQVAWMHSHYYDINITNS